MVLEALPRYENASKVVENSRLEDEISFSRRRSGAAARPKFMLSFPWLFVASLLSPDFIVVGQVNFFLS